MSESCNEERRHEKERRVERLCVFYFRLLYFLVTSPPTHENTVLCWERVTAE